MNIAGWLIDKMKILGEAGVDSPRRDALVLLEDTLGRDRSWVLANHDYEIPEAQLAEVNRLIKRRENREPLAYIRKKAWFYGRFFYVDERVLIPRPESENIITIAKGLQIHSVLDIGTGSGCLAITLALEVPAVTKIVATDVSESALKIAKRNADTHKVEISFLKTSLTTNLLENAEYDVVVANLPYVPTDNISSPEINVEPKEALFGGKDGLDLYREFWNQIGLSSNQPKYIIVESLESQHANMDKLARESGYFKIKTDILIQLYCKA